MHKNMTLRTPDDSITRTVSATSRYRLTFHGTNALTYQEHMFQSEYLTLVFSRPKAKVVENRSELKVKKFLEKWTKCDAL